MTCGILVPQPGIELVPPSEEAWSAQTTGAGIPLIFIFNNNLAGYKPSKLTIIFLKTSPQIY